MRKMRKERGDKETKRRQRKEKEAKGKLEALLKEEQEKGWPVEGSNSSLQ